MSKVETKRGVLVIAAHPDDEVLGCGGVLALHTIAGEPVTVVIACDGETNRCGPHGIYQPSHILQAAEMLGVHDVRCLGFTDQALDTIRLTTLIEPLTRIMREVRP